MIDLEAGPLFRTVMTTRCRLAPEGPALPDAERGASFLRSSKLVELLVELLDAHLLQESGEGVAVMLGACGGPSSQNLCPSFLSFFLRGLGLCGAHS